MTTPDDAAPAARTAGVSTAVVLCGGTSRRMGGRDKTALPFGDSTVLDHLLDSLPPDWPVVCVGEPRHTHRQVAWTRESPPGGGPVAGMTAGLAVVATPLVVLLAGDLPFAGPAAAHLSLVAGEGGGVDAVVATDGDGRAQPLLAAYRSAALRAALPADPAGARLMGVLDALVVDLVAVAAPACLDVDTPEALVRARARLTAP